MMRRSWILALCLVGCVGPLDGRGGSADDLTSVQGSEYTIDYDSFVYVPAGASDDYVRWQIQRQVKSSLGALRERGIGVLDRDAQRNLDPADGSRAPLTVIEADGASAEAIERVTFHYRDTALVDGGSEPHGPVQLTLLFGDYAARRDELVPACSDDADAAADSLWYHCAPGQWSCRTRITGERDAINAANGALDDANTEVSRADVDRRFVTALAALEPVEAAPERFPEYDQLWGFAGNTARTKLVVYSMFGVDRDEADPHDNGLREFLRFQRTLRARFPDLRVVDTRPFAMLLDFWIDGRKLDGVTFDDVERWIVDGDGWPAEVAGDAARRAALLDQVVEHFSERWIVWQLPVRVTLDGAARDMTVELRALYGYEDGSPDVRPRATSAAKLGPDRTACVVSGKTSARTSPISLPLRCSIPFAHKTMGWPERR